MKQSFEYLSRVVELRTKGNYSLEDMTQDENYDPTKVYYSCFSETDNGHECVLVYAFDKAKYENALPPESLFDDAKYAVLTIPCSSWK